MRTLPILILPLAFITLAEAKPDAKPKAAPATPAEKPAAPSVKPAPPAEPQEPAGEKADTNPHDAALANLLSAHETTKDLDDAITAARKNGIAEQAILEARFLHHVDHDDDDAIAAMLPELLKHKPDFKLEDSAIFGTEEDWLAVIGPVEAIAALKKGDKAEFKSHITEAFWLSPKQATAFAPHIERVRMDEAMSALKIDFADKFIPLAGGDAMALKQAMGDKKAMILHFWAPSSPECEEGMPDYATTAKALGEKGISMVSIMTEDTPKALTDGRKMIQPLGEKPPGAWILDRKEKPLSRALRVQSLPVFVLVSNEGKILFNGDPSDDRLWQALLKIDPSIARPVKKEAMEHEDE